MWKQLIETVPAGHNSLDGTRAEDRVKRLLEDNPHMKIVLMVYIELEEELLLVWEPK